MNSTFIQRAVFHSIRQIGKPANAMQMQTTFNCRHLSSSPILTQEKKLFTPGPLGVSMSTREAMLRDLGSRDVEFIKTVKYLRDSIIDIAGLPHEKYTCVPVQGSGTYAIEAVIQTTVPRNGGKLLILANGSYGKRMAKICDVVGIDYQMEVFPENEKVDHKRLRKLLNKDKSFTNIAVVHCETSSGVINDVAEIGQIIKINAPNAIYFVDGMSSFGAMPLDLEQCGVDYLVSSANKCLEGVPGFSYAIARTDHLRSCKGQSRSLTLDLYDQYEGLESNGQFRFTPPTHTMLALKQAITELQEEGGVAGRAKRYKRNRQILREGMAKLGFEEFLDSSHEGYIITSYKFPTHPNFNFETFYTKLNEKDQVIYPGKVLDADCFRIGNIGHLFPKDMRYLLKCIAEVCLEMKMPFRVPM